MTKELLKNYIDLGYSTYRIGTALGKSQGAIKYWLKKYELRTTTNSKQKVFIESGLKFKICPKCHNKKEVNNTNFYIQKSGELHSWCKDCNNQSTIDRQREFKLQAIEYKGGKCVYCGYNRCAAGLDFHHLDPSKKEYNIGSFRTFSLDLAKKELNKCELVCRNCHAEIHAGVLTKSVQSGSPVPN